MHSRGPLCVFISGNAERSSFKNYVHLLHLLLWYKGDWCKNMENKYAKMPWQSYHDPKRCSHSQDSKSLKKAAPKKSKWDEHGPSVWRHCTSHAHCNSDRRRGWHRHSWWSHRWRWETSAALRSAWSGRVKWAMDSSRSLPVSPAWRGHPPPEQQTDRNPVGHLTSVG